MPSFIRKNLITLQGVFNQQGWCPPDWHEDSPPQPTNVTAIVRYTNPAGATQSDNINLSMDADTKVWSCTWDTSASGPGRVDWSIFSTGPVVAATQGFFYVDANPANLEA